jgi:hypothetical protein
LENDDAGEVMQEWEEFKYSRIYAAGRGIVKPMLSVATVEGDQTSIWSRNESCMPTSTTLQGPQPMPTERPGNTSTTCSKEPDQVQSVVL